MADIELGVFVDPYASTKAKQKAQAITRKVISTELNYPFTERDPLCQVPISSDNLL